MDRVWLTIAVLGMVGLGCGNRDKASAPSFAERSPKVGEAAPEFSLSTLSGGTVSLAPDCGKTPTVLIFGSYS